MEIQLQDSFWRYLNGNICVDMPLYQGIVYESELMLRRHSVVRLLYSFIKPQLAMIPPSSLTRNMHGL